MGGNSQDDETREGVLLNRQDKRLTKEQVVVWAVRDRQVGSSQVKCVRCRELAWVRGRQVSNIQVKCARCRQVIHE